MALRRMAREPDNQEGQGPMFGLGRGAGRRPAEGDFGVIGVVAGSGPMLDLPGIIGVIDSVAHCSPLWMGDQFAVAMCPAFNDLFIIDSEAGNLVSIPLDKEVLGDFQQTVLPVMNEHAQQVRAKLVSHRRWTIMVAGQVASGKLDVDQPLPDRKVVDEAQACLQAAHDDVVTALRDFVVRHPAA